MTASLISIKKRIKSVDNTKKITHAMEMISSLKLTRARTALFAARPYFSRLESITKDFLANIENPSHPLLEKREAVKRSALCVITSDTGLCSLYNYGVIRAAEDYIRSRGAAKVILIAVGRDGFNHFKGLQIEVSGSRLDMHGRYSDELSDGITDQLAGLFLGGSVDEAHVAYTEFTSTLRQKPRIEKLLNVDYQGKIGAEYIIEPDAARVMEELLKEYVYSRFRMMLLNAFTSEHAARMIAMKMATDNANELSEKLTLLRNKARQASITKEVLEVAMAAEALKG